MWKLATDFFELHFVSSHVTQSEYDGNTLEAFENYFINTHQRSIDKNEFNAFMHNSWTFYYPDLTDLIRELDADGVAYVHWILAPRQDIPTTPPRAPPRPTTTHHPRPAT